MRKLLVIGIVSLAVLGGGVATNTAHAENTRAMCPGIIRGVNFYRQTTWTWQEKLGLAKTRAAHKRFHSCKFALWTAHRWMKRSSALRIRHIRYLQYRRSQTLITSDWQCIHSHEGDWEDGGNPYWGGLQMDLNFMYAYGRDMIRKYGAPYGSVGPNGWANAWSPGEQVMVANRAKASRGYSPWPNTAAMCGLY